MSSRRPSDLLPLPHASLHVLAALAAGERHGYAIMTDVEEMTDGVVTMGPGTLYGTLRRLEKDDLVEPCEGPADDDSGGPERRYYRLTNFGQLVLDAETARLRSLLHAVRTGTPRPATGGL